MKAWTTPIAIDRRGWLLGELVVDVPTLKIVGSGSNIDLIKAAREKMPRLLGGASHLGIEESRAPELSAPAAQIVSPANEASSSSIESGYPYSTPSLHCHGRGNHTTRLTRVVSAFTTVPSFNPLCTSFDHSNPQASLAELLLAAFLRQLPTVLNQLRPSYSRHQ